MLNQIFKNLFRRKTRTVLTLSGIAVGVAMIVALGAMGEGLRTGYVSMFSGSGANLVMLQKGSYDITFSGVDEDIVTRVAAMPEVSAAGGIVVGNVTAPGSPSFYVFGYDPKGFAIQRFKLVEGQMLGASHQATNSREILLGRQAAEALKLKLGDILRLPGGSFRIVGIYATGSGFEDAASVLSLADGQQLLQKLRQVGAVQIKLRDPRQIDQVREKLERLYPKLTISESSRAADDQQVVSLVQGLAWGIALLAIIIGGVGMTNTVMMSAFERTREIGTLRALGWSRWRVLTMVLGESALLGVVGGLLGCAAGAALIVPMSQSAVLGYLQGKLTLPLLAQGMTTAVVLGALGGIYPAWWASRLMPIEALRYEGGAANIKSPWRAVQAGQAQVFQVGTRKSETLRSLWRRRGRTVLTLVGISIGMASVVALSGMADGFVREFGKMFSGGDADLIACQKGASDLEYSAMSERVGKQIAAIPGVQSVSGMVVGGVTMEENPFFMFQGYDPQEPAIRHFKIVRGRGLAGNHELILGQSGADVLKVSIGDTVRLGEIGFRVVGIFETGITWEEGAGVITLRDGQALLGKPHQVSLYVIKVRDPQQIESVRKQIEASIPEITAPPSSDVTEYVPEIQSGYVVVWAISALAIIVGGIGMMNTMIMSVFERTREIGTLRALGWKRRRVLGMVLKESLALSLTGVPIGIVLAELLTVALQQVPAWGTFVSVILTPGLLTQTLTVALGLGAVGGLYPAWRAANLRPVEALRYE